MGIDDFDSMFTTFKAPWVDAVFPTLFAEEIVSVQPITDDSADCFTLDFAFGDNDMASTLRGIPPLPYNVATLIPILEKNRAEHASLFEEGRAAYIKLCIETFKERALKIETGEIKDLEEMTEFDLPAPTEHLDIYDSVIGMLKLTTQTTVDLNAAQFNAWVRDQWDWKEAFTRNIMNYTSAL